MLMLLVVPLCWALCGVVASVGVVGEKGLWAIWWTCRLRWGAVCVCVVVLDETDGCGVDKEGALVLSDVWEGWNLARSPHTERERENETPLSIHPAIVRVPTKGLW